MNEILFETKVTLLICYIGILLIALDIRTKINHNSLICLCARNVDPITKSSIWTKDVIDQEQICHTCPNSSHVWWNMNAII